MKQHILIGLVILGGTLLNSGCGGGGNNSQVCSLAVERLFAVCDQNDPNDVDAIWNALQGQGIEVSNEEIEQADEAQIKSECVAALDEGGEEITDEDVTAFDTALDDAATCQEVISVITGSI